MTELTAAKKVHRWWQLIGCVAMMMAIANLQYAWTLFTIPLTKALGVKLSAVQLAFTLFILFETWLVPFEGYLIDKLGVRKVVSVGAVLVGLAWVGASRPFLVTLAIALLSDVVDGLLARWLGQTSELGARLDSTGDLLLYVVLPICGIWLRPDFVRAEIGWFGVAVGAAMIPAEVEELAITSVLREWRADVPSLRHALAIRAGG